MRVIMQSLLKFWGYLGTRTSIVICSSDLYSIAAFVPEVDSQMNTLLLIICFWHKSFQIRVVFGKVKLLHWSRINTVSRLPFEPSRANQRTKPTTVLCCWLALNRWNGISFYVRPRILRTMYISRFRYFVVSPHLRLRSLSSSRSRRSKVG